MSPGGKAAPIYVVDRTDVVRVFVDISEHDANYVREGSKATVMIRAFRDRLIPATVTRTSWALNVKSRTLRAEIDLHNTETPEDYRDRGEHQADKVKAGTKIQILPGMYAYGKVIIDRSDVMSLPEAALVRQGERTFCWTCDKGRAVRTEIETGITDGEWVEVTNRQVLPAAGSDADPWAPIDGTEQVILGDLSILTDGGPVNVAADDSSTPRKTAGAPSKSSPR